MNPTMRLYQMNAEYHVPVEFTSYRTNIEASNRLDEIQIEHWTDFARDFEMRDLSPKSHLDLSTSFLYDPLAASKYQHFRLKHDLESDSDCDVQCQRRVFCETFTSIIEHKVICYGEQVVKFKEHADLLILTAMTNPWIQEIRQDLALQ